MKKTLALLLVASIVSISSCKKKYSCNCEVWQKGQFHSYETSREYKVKKENKDQAAQDCAQLDSKLENDPDNLSAICKFTKQ